MAKLMDVLKKREPLPDAAPPAAPAPDAPCQCGDAPVEPEEVLPYIEIDGATRTLAGSPDVITVTTVEQPVAPSPPPRVALVSPALVYQPWPGPAADPARVAAELVVFHEPESAASRQYVQLLEQLLHAERPPQALLFTGGVGTVGLGIPVLNLAIAACQQKHRKVVVLGMEGPPPAVTSCLGLPPAPDLQQVLDGRIALEQALQTSPIANLSVLAIGGQRPVAAWSRDALRWVITWLRSRFPLLFLEVGAWRGTPEQLLLAGMCDGVYPIVPAADGRSAELQPLLQSILAQGGPVRGLIHIQPRPLS
jgi:Mrp family chromosome partitioning ATPase